MVTTQSSLLVRLRTRDDSAAWSRFVRIYTPLIHHWVTRLGVESNHVHDIVQEVFMVLLGRVSWVADNPPKQFRAWLRTVTVNKCRDHFRRNRRQSEPQLSDQLEVASEDPAAIFTEREYQMFVAQSAMQLMRDAFSETTWRACWENVVCGRSAHELARELGISKNAVYLARGRVLKRLRAELDGLWE
jgi:RNA polymerase sigma-70 factor (ECF subfamily)